MSRQMLASLPVMMRRNVQLLDLSDMDSANRATGIGVDPRITALSAEGGVPTLEKDGAVDGILPARGALKSALNDLFAQAFAVRATWLASLNPMEDCKFHEKY